MWKDLFLEWEWFRFPLILFYRQVNDAGYPFWTEEQKEDQWEVCVEISWVYFSSPCFGKPLLKKCNFLFL